MHELVTYFDPQPQPSEVPSRLADPFAEGTPHPLAQRAAADLRHRVRRRELAAELDLAGMDEPGRGKMFGVLIVSARDGRLGYLNAFSGMLGERWHLEGFAPPLFDLAERDAFWPAVEAELYALERVHAELTDGAEAQTLRARHAELLRKQQSAAAELQARHLANRRSRHEQRASLGSLDVDEGVRRELHRLAQLSRADEEEQRRLSRSHREEREAVDAALRTLDERRVELERSRAERSRQVWRRIADGYRIPNARGEERTVGDLYAPDPPPGGAGDCAAPKLLAYAFRNGLEPRALAEFWWGAPPLTGERFDGEFYPACRRRCGVVLPFMLQGLG